jgi:transposase
VGDRRLASLYSSTGRPSVDPELMIRMLLVGYCFGIRSERQTLALTAERLKRLGDLPLLLDAQRTLLG